eukprot:c16698_g1_i1.p1 GENE.c16698_g1_i1~~c16698_g1_i1.p1  ORF type:complete len:226 (-),score=28.23 c16698_g1_i1:14-691(-)
MRTRFYLSGFGKFAGVEDNPSKTLIETLRDRVGVDTGSSVVICDARVVDVHMGAAVEAVRDVCRLRDMCLAQLSADERIVFLHLGVAASSPRFCIEQSAWNDATFRVCDEAGNQPIQHCIAETLPLGACRQTTLPLASICASLERSGYGGDVFGLSQDPGRFVCNYIYFTSLGATEGLDRTASLFLHIPPFEAIAFERQLGFVLALMDAIAATSADGSGDGASAE